MICQTRLPAGGPPESEAASGMVRARRPFTPRNPPRPAIAARTVDAP